MPGRLVQLAVGAMREVRPQMLADMSDVHCVLEAIKRPAVPSVIGTLVRKLEYVTVQGAWNNKPFVACCRRDVNSLSSLHRIGVGR